ncbi:MAG: hypothetical protein Kow006_01200 [Gammaproteobacteria bacterium]
MNADAMDFLLWVRGPGFVIALTIFVFGVLVRLFEVLALGRKPDLAPPRENSPGSGWRTLVMRSVPPPGMFRRSPVTYIGGYVFHIGLFLIVFFYVPHIAFIKDLLGVSWPGLPSTLIDAVTVATFVALVAVLINRLNDPVKRFLSTVEDYVTWVVTVLPVLTGYLAYHHFAPDYTAMLALHILSVELLLVVLPFTKLMHAFTFAIGRWYTGEMHGRKGVAS